MIKKLIDGIFSNVSEDTKERVYQNIKKENSTEYQWQVVHNAITNQVIDDILADPIWGPIAREAAQTNKMRG